MMMLLTMSINMNYKLPASLYHGSLSPFQFSSFLSSVTLTLMSARGEVLPEEEEEASWCGERESVVFQLRNLNMFINL